MDQTVLNGLTGELRDRLLEVLLCSGEAAKVVGPWLRGDVGDVPKAHLKQLGLTMRGLEASAIAAVREAQIVYRLIDAEYEKERAAEQARAAAVRP